MEQVVPGGRCDGGQIQKGTFNVTKSGCMPWYLIIRFRKILRRRLFLFWQIIGVSAWFDEGFVDHGLSCHNGFFISDYFFRDSVQEAAEEVTSMRSASIVNLGYAKRYFTLSASTGELSYSQSSHNPILRGTIPLALAALNIDYGRREFILDSGADIWHLRATSESEFEVWKTD
jgi:hypothetical protein